MGARQCYSTIVVRPAGVAEDTVLSNRVARGGRQRLTPDGQGRLACPNPAGPKTSAAKQAALLLFAPEHVAFLKNVREAVICWSRNFHEVVPQSRS